jgi:hypothetical protein
MKNPLKEGFPHSIKKAGFLEGEDLPRMHD